jgi:hypothetical protein
MGGRKALLLAANAGVAAACGSKWDVGALAVRSTAGVSSVSEVLVVFEIGRAGGLECIEDAEQLGEIR